MEEKDFLQELSDWGAKVKEYDGLQEEIEKGLEKLVIAVMQKADVEEVVFDVESGEDVGYWWLNSDGGEVNEIMTLNKASIKNGNLFIKGDCEVGDVTIWFREWGNRIVYLNEKYKIVEAIMKKLGYDIQKKWADLY